MNPLTEGGRAGPREWCVRRAPILSPTCTAHTATCRIRVRVLPWPVRMSSPHNIRCAIIVQRVRVTPSGRAVSFIQRPRRADQSEQQRVARDGGHGDSCSRGGARPAVQLQSI